VVKQWDDVITMKGKEEIGMIVADRILRAGGREGGFVWITDISHQYASLMPVSLR
jgi:hypothetical protein